MPLLLTILVSFCALTLVACKSSDADKPSVKAVSGKNRPTSNTANASTAPVTNKPAIRAANVVSGRVVGVRDALRFVIVDFANGRMPQLDQRLNVYRQDQKVAEVKISGPYRGTTVAADITVGDAMLGDLVREY